MREFEREKFLALKYNSNDYERYMDILKTLVNYLHWWGKTICRASNSIRNFSPAIELYTDASRTSWVTACGSKHAHGFWPDREKQIHINGLELLAVKYGLQCFTSALKNCDFLLRIDNTTTIAYINRKDGVRYPRLQKTARNIWTWCEKRNLWIFASYIRSEDNRQSDFESRRLEPETEFSLAKVAYKEICEKLGNSEIDLFASRINAKCQKYVSWKKHSGDFVQTVQYRIQKMVEL